ncbi:AAA family ATPase [Aquibacillus halophilus]|uniref:DNA 3'-5' helicase n=1 Tax=Aquibacillus halophilus TaxID=930132 RepID=A0A6A8DC20_9BACI|nr:UvrD-helicase domain-containing protein [Aquibacillus halophilus]MRH41321.1 AAA family ATPase [Aquibacillus halophilus]
MSKVIIDQAAREKIKHELTTNFLVEAGAGSGKTTSLVDRLVNLIYTGRCEVNKLVAITFTRKAADELQLRFQSELEKKWRTEPNGSAQSLLSHALQNIEQCFIGTVHAFCAKLLRERPIEARLDLTFQELDETDDNDLLEEAWHVYLQWVQENKPEHLAEMNDLGISIDDLFECLKNLKQYPDVEWVTRKVEKPELQSTYQSLSMLVQEAKKALPEQEPKNKYDSLQKAIIGAIMKIRHLDSNLDKNIIEIFELFNKNLKPTLNRWDSKEDAKFYHEKITSISEKMIKPLLQSWWEYSHPKVTTFLSGAMDLYDQLKKERSLLNYQDLLLKTNALLKDNSEIRGYFQQKYRCLLVDEFQDTDPIQAEIMFFLTSEDHKQKVWTKCKPIPGSLFVVGDPKQAIYRFRRADIDTYNRVKQLIEDHGGEVLQLTMNFRTVDTITESLNTVFQGHLPEQETVYQAAFHPLHAYHNDQHNNLSGVKQLTVPADYSTKGDIIENDAKNIGRYIHDRMDEGYKAKDFMVLTRYNDGIATYAQTIEDFGIAVSVSGEIIIGETTEFQDLLRLLSTFIDPTDQLAFVATLRGVFFGISDDDLYQCKQAGGRFSLYSSIPTSLAKSTKDKFTIAVTKLSAYHKWIRTLPPTAAIENIIEDVGFYPLLLKNKRGKRAHKGLLQILEAIRQAESTGNTTYKAICELFSEMVMEKTVVANLEEEADAVRVMNVHKAKGLEAPIVFLAHPIKQVKPDSFLSQHIKREDDHSKGYFSFSVKKGFQQKTLALPLDWESLKQEELRYLTEEETRILYVAATRAEKALIISSSAKNDNKNPWSQLFEIETIEQIELPAEEIANTGKQDQVISFESYQEQTRNRLAWLEKSKQNTYDTWSPTEDKSYDDVLTIEREAGGGKEWGTVIHDVLEQVVQGEDVTHYVRNKLTNHNLPHERQTGVLEYIRLFKASDIWEKLQSADEILTEVPFSLKLNAGDQLYSLLKRENGQQTIYVKGVIDLIYRFQGEWTIVDYKTDRVKKEDDLNLLRDFYRDQIIFYQHAWEYMTGEKVKDVRLFFFSEHIKIS